jgi:hypothetical protein
MATNAGVGDNKLASNNRRTGGGSPNVRRIARRGNNDDFRSLKKNYYAQGKEGEE